MEERTLYSFLFEAGGIEGTGPIERLEGVYRQLYTLTLQHPGFRKAQREKNPAADRIVKKIDAYAKDFDEVKDSARRGESYESGLVRLTVKLERWSQTLEGGYRQLANAFLGKIEGIEKLTDNASDLLMVAVVREVGNYLDEIRANSKPDTDAKPQEVDALVLKLGEAMGKLDQFGTQATKLLERTYGLSETDLGKVRQIVTDSNKRGEVDYKKLGDVFAEAAKGVSAKIDSKELDPLVRAAVEAALKDRTFPVDPEAMKSVVETALQGKVGPVDKGAVTSAVSEALGNYFRDKQLQVDPNSVRTAVDKAFEGRTLSVDPTAINSAVATAVSQYFTDRKLPVDSDAIKTAIVSAVGEALKDRTIPVDLKSIDLNEPMEAALRTAVDKAFEGRKVPVDQSVVDAVVKTAIEKAMEGRKVSVDTQPIGEAVRAALDKELQGRTVPVDVESVNKAVDAALKGRTIPIDQGSVDTAVSTAFGGIRTEFSGYIQRLQELGSGIIGALSGYRTPETARPERVEPEPRPQEPRRPQGGAPKPPKRDKPPAVDKPPVPAKSSGPKPASAKPADDDDLGGGGEQPFNAGSFVDDIFGKGKEGKK